MEKILQIHTHIE